MYSRSKRGSLTVQAPNSDTVALAALQTGVLLHLTTG